MNRVAIRYAKALLKLATTQQVLSNVHADVQLLYQACTEHTALRQLIHSPIVSHAKKNTLLQALFQGKVHKLTCQFLALITKKRREALLPDMLQAFLDQYDRQEGIQKACVTTPTPLSDTQLQQIQQLAQKIAPSQHLILTQQLAPTLIGGFVLQTADHRLDQSLRKKLHTLQKHCVAQGY